MDIWNMRMFIAYLLLNTIITLDSIEGFLFYNLFVSYSRRIESFQQNFELNSVFKRNPVAHETIGWDKSFYELFLSTYWQKKPLLVRQALPKGFLQVSNQTLLQLTEEEDVESRIVKQTKRKWEKEYGPFEKGFFDSLPMTNWTVLIQEVDRHIPNVAMLWDQSFSFIPEWRRDDIMISYAKSGGGIGAHVDNYDVFLLQGRGTREWSIENKFLDTTEEESRSVRNSETKLIRNFSKDQSWILEEGDMLYLPPRLPHQGISLSDECITVSFGFRAPTYRSMVTALCEKICSTISKDEYYSDENISNTKLFHAIDFDTTQNIIKKIRNKVSKVLDNYDPMEEWLGTYLSTPLRMREQRPKPFFLDNNQIKSMEIIDDQNDENVLLQENIFLYEDDESKEDDEDDNDNDNEDNNSRNTAYKTPINASNRKFPSIDAIIESVRKQEIVLYRYGGLKILHNEHDKIFVDGKVFTLTWNYDLPFRERFPTQEERFYDYRVVDENRINAISTDIYSANLSMRLLKLFLSKGYYYPVDR